MLSSSKASKRKLSKNLLQMKFMKRTKEKEEKEAEKEEERLVLGKKPSELGRVYTEPSVHVACGLRFGRLSFQGMNPEIERMMDDEKERREGGNCNDLERDVSDQTMANTLTRTLARKFSSKRERQLDDQDSEDDEDKTSKYNIRKKKLDASAQKRVKTEIGHKGRGRGRGRTRKFMKPSQDF